MLAFLRQTFFSFIPAWIIAFVFASVLHSHFVLFELAALDIDIPVSKWLTMVLEDLSGLLPTYGAIIAVTLTLSFFIASRLNSLLEKRALTLTKNGAAGIFGAAGAIGFLVMLAAMQPILDVTLIAGARSHLGIAAQCIAGFVSGIVYGRLR
ncbi:hypothetical protein [Alteromonas sp. P256]|uniref:hypothetical protein n=1 Tax=Alteromonas sp. P256 TaxID=3117399 RepID=UPI002FE2FCD3